MSGLAFDWPDDDEDDLFVDGEIGYSDIDSALFECGVFMDGGRYTCSMAGSELCDWECPMGGYGWWNENEDPSGEKWPF